MIGPIRGRSSRRIALLALTLAVGLGLPAAASADQWYKTDPHVHSTFSGDATDDIGIIATAAKERGYDAIFLTDHTATSNNEIGGVVANNVTLDENDFQNWSLRTFGTLTSFADAEASTPVNTGAKSLRLSATTGSADYGETFRWYKRGPHLRSGDSILKFSVYPTQIDANSGLYVSVSLGGDATITSRPPQGYTTQDNVPHPGKTNVLVWQLGNARSPSTAPDARVTTHNLPYTLNQWNTYTINVSQAVRDEVPAAEMPLDYNAFTQLKMAAGGQGGTATGFFDTYSLKASAPHTSPEEFVYRNGRVHDFDTPTFSTFASQEVGWNRHAMMFNFDITDQSQYILYKQGFTSIAPTQASGYPAQLNHPGLPGGVTQDDAITNLGYGADTMEVAERSDEEGFVKNVMVDTWDDILQQGHQLMGAWTSDMHRVERLGPATYLMSPNRSFNALMQASFEGRSYLANHDFPGRAVFNTDGSANTYAARYPTYVSPSQTLANVHFKVSDGITPGSRVLWTSNGSVIATDRADGPSFDGYKTVPLGGAFTYVRAEVRNAAGVRLAMSQPIFFRDAPGLLPNGMDYNVTGVTTPTGHNYTRTATQGITSSSWDATPRQLTLGLTNPSGSLDAIRMSTGGASPSGVTVDGTVVAPAASKAAFDAATGSSWWFDGSDRTLLLKAKQTGGTASAVVSFTDGADTTPPATPELLTAHAHGAERIDLNWHASSGGAARGYTVYRDGIAIAIVPPGSTSFTDSALAAGTRFTYAVDAFDASANHSAQSDPASATTDVVSILTYEPTADSYVDESLPNTNYGNSTSLRIDGSPLLRGYLRYDLTGVSGTIEKVTLRMFNNSRSAGYDVHGTSNTWGETTLKASNAPPPADVLLGSSNGGDAGGWSEADVTSAVTGNGQLSLTLDAVNTSAINFSSRQGPNAPQLVVQTSVPSNDAPQASDRTLSAIAGTQASWTPAVNDPDGDTVSCEIVDAPAHGSAAIDPNCSAGTYTSTPGYSGPDSFTYRATDPSGEHSNVATVSATVTSTNHAPAASDASVTAQEDTPGSWTPSVADADGGDSATCTIVAQPAHGSATVAANCSGGTYTPSGNYHGPDSFTYRATDSHGADSNVAAVSATVSSVNDPPTAADRTLNAQVGEQANWSPSVSDVDNDTLTCQIATAPAHGTATVAADCSGGTYTPAAGHEGADPFSYRAVDSHGAPSNDAAVNVTVSDPNDPPSAADRSLTTAEDTQGSWSPSVSDPDGDSTSCAIVSQPTHGSATVASDCSGGTYVPAANYHGPDSFTYRATDPDNAQSAPATVSATVTAANDPPAAADRSLTTAEDTAGSWTPSVGDPDSGDTRACAIVAQPAHGSATVAADCSGGSYTPGANYNGPDSFTYRVTDGAGAQSAPASVAVTVTAVNDAPTAANRSVTAADGAPGAWSPSVSDPEGGALTCAIVGQPSHGTASVAADCSTGSYTPTAGYSGSDSFTYRATDPGGAQSSPATVSATVTQSGLFSDGFETGTLAAWSSSRGLTVQSALVNTGTFAARGQSTNGVSWAKRTLPGTYSDVTYRLAFRAQAAPTGSPTIMRFRSAADKALVGLYLTSTRKLGLRNDVTATSKSSATALTAGRWYQLELHAVVNGAASSVEVRVDGTKIADLSSAVTDLGTAGIGILQLGENAAGPVYDFAYDDVFAQRNGVGLGKVSALSRAPRCTSTSRVRLSGARRQRIARTGRVRVLATSVSDCRVTAVAMARDKKGKPLVRSKRRTVALPAASTGALELRFSSRDRRTIRRALVRRPVDVLVYALPGKSVSRVLAQRRVIVKP
jgi:hypothetical protein